MTRDRLEVGAILDRKYKLLRRLGEGGMGVVFEAEHLKIRGRVAVKVLNEQLVGRGDAVRRFVQEARAASTIGHPGIVPVIDLGGLEPGRRPYLVMELLRGANLARLMAFYGPLNPETVACVLLDVLSALGAAHGQGILHRDLKPDNVFVALEATEVMAKVVDFGVSKFLHDRHRGGLTQTGTVMGTPTYMSPEQARGERHLDARVDVYACGVIFYEALCGQPPFQSDNYNALLQQIIAAPIEPVRTSRPDVPPDLEALVFRAMARDLSERFASAGEMADALLAVFDRDELRRARRGLHKAVAAMPEDVPQWRQEEVVTATDPDGEPIADEPPEIADEEPTNLFIRALGAGVGPPEPFDVPPEPLHPPPDELDAASARLRTIRSLDELDAASGRHPSSRPAEALPLPPDLDAPSATLPLGPDAEAAKRARLLGRRRSAPDLSAGRATFAPPLRTPEDGVTQPKASPSSAPTSAADEALPRPGGLPESSRPPVSPQARSLPGLEPPADVAGPVAPAASEPPGAPGGDAPVAEHEPDDVLILELDEEPGDPP